MLISLYSLEFGEIKNTRQQKSFPHGVENSIKFTYIYINSTRHASRQISVPGRVFFFYHLPRANR